MGVRNPIGLEKSVNNLEIALSNICNRMVGKDKGEACKLLEKSKNEQYVENKIDLINMFLTKIPHLLEETEQGKNGSNIYNYQADQLSVTMIDKSKISQQNSGINNKTYKESTEKSSGLIGSIIDLINPPATIAAFAGFIISETLDFHPIGYNKQVISVGLDFQR